MMCISRIWFTAVALQLTLTLSGQVESELRNDFFAFYQNGTFDDSYVKLFGNGNRGTLQFFNQNYNLVGWFDANSEDAGYMGIRSNSSNMLATLNSILNFPDHGILSLYGGANERILAQLYAGTDMVGSLLTQGPNSQNIYLGYFTGYTDHGYVGVMDNSDAFQAGMYVDASGQGTIFATVKNFVEPHPTDDNLEIVYASIEGPEAAAYIRGVAALQEGSARIEFPEHFTTIADLEDLTIQLTPQSADTYGLAVVTKDASGFNVQELQAGRGYFSFDWEAKATRKGFKNYQVVRNKAHRKAAMKSPLLQGAQVPTVTTPKR